MDPQECFRGRIGIVGSGALGCFYGARLSRAGFDVHFLMRRDCEHVRRHGLKVYSFEGDFDIRPPVHATAGEMGRCGLVIVGLKTTDNAALPELLGPLCDAHTTVLTLQNGLGNEEAIVDALAGNGACATPGDGRAQVTGGIAFLCSNRTEPGTIRHTAHGWIRIAEFAGAATQRTHAVAAMFRAAGIDCEVSDSLKTIRWAKLVWNVPFNGLGVGAGHAHTAAILGDAVLLAAARGLMEEVVAAATADGATLEPGIIDRMIGSTHAMGDYCSSMQLDYESGRPLEVEAILGEPYRRATTHGVAVPRFGMLYGIVRRLDRVNRDGF